MDRRLWAENYVSSLLADNPRRLAHSRAVATIASELADVLLDDPDDRSVLVTAAWLHDIGYAPALATTGAHHLDGALHLEELGEHRLACLVAHHGSGAAETALRGFSDEFAQFPRELSLVADILTFCDLSCGPDGTRLSLDERLREIRARYGDDHVVVRGLEADDDVIRGAFRRVELRLAEAEPDATTQAITGSGRDSPK
ncbi:MAG: HD domain-containing protein [Acidimicrobiaceae bacterium]|nr:HD domain-containing protein [Acidimicrobiaceae bacterium]